MNTITTVVVTVLANAIVTGIIVYFLQKKIEHSFARKMEEFKASIQYSIFEQQTKFKMIHEKRVEALESLCGKYKVFCEAMRKDLDKFSTSYFFIANDRKLLGKFGFIPFQRLSEFWEYFEKNRLFLSDHKRRSK